MYSKDFNILGLKIDSTNNKKDISFVTDINSYVQKIENVCRLQKGEIPSTSYLGTNYYSFIFDPRSNRSSLESEIANSIKSAIKDISKVKVKVMQYNDVKITLNVTFSLGYQKTNNETTCKIEVDLV